MIPSILLDSNAGAPIHPLVVSALLAFLKEQSTAPVGNPSSLHAFGRRSSALIAKAKEGILQSLHADPNEWNVVFTSGGTEANQLAIRGVLEHALGEGKGRPVWVVSPLEHHCVLDLIEPMRKRGVEVRVLQAGLEGEVIASPEDFKDATLVSLMEINNETGIQIRRSFITSHIQSASADLTAPLLHADFVAGWGKLDLDLSSDGVPDLIAIAGHKLGALSGTGALIYRRSISLQPLLRGAQQEALRGGTENIIGILSLLTLTENWEQIRAENESLRHLRDEFERQLKGRFHSVKITGEGGTRAPHISHFVFQGLPKALSFVAQLDLRGFAVSSGSACASAVPEPSHVLSAMGLSRVDALNALRVSLHPGNRMEDLTGLVLALEAILKRYEAH